MTEQTHPLATPVNRVVRHDLTVRFRGESYNLRGIPKLVSGMTISITHYGWYPHHHLIVNFVNNEGTAGNWQVVRTDMSQAA